VNHLGPIGLAVGVLLSAADAIVTKAHPAG
jgi:hypothetical protein